MLLSLYGLKTAFNDLIISDTLLKLEHSE